MVKTIKLAAKSGNLSLEINEQNWCVCFLEYEGHRIRLGADADNIVIERLLSGLINEKNETHYKINNVDVFCVMTLFEDHHTLYASEKDDRALELYWQDSNAKIICTMLLSYSERKAWIEQLSRQ